MAAAFPDSAAEADATEPIDAFAEQTRPLRVRLFTLIATALVVMVLAVAAARPGPGFEAKAVPQLRIDVNSADAGALQLLSGIGPALAGRIIETRQQQRFTDVEDLQRVSGIGPIIAERMAPHVAFGGRTGESR